MLKNQNQKLFQTKQMFQQAWSRIFFLNLYCYGHITAGLLVTKCGISFLYLTK